MDDFAQKWCTVTRLDERFCLDKNVRTQCENRRIFLPRIGVKTRFDGIFTFGERCTVTRFDDRFCFSERGTNRVDIWEFLCHSDFTWTQFWLISEGSIRRKIQCSGVVREWYSCRLKTSYQVLIYMEKIGQKSTFTYKSWK